MSHQTARGILPAVDFRVSHIIGLLRMISAPNVAADLFVARVKGKTSNFNMFESINSIWQVNYWFADRGLWIFQYHGLGLRLSREVQSTHIIKGLAGLLLLRSYCSVLYHASSLIINFLLQLVLGLFIKNQTDSFDQLLSRLGVATFGSCWFSVNFSV